MDGDGGREDDGAGDRESGIEGIKGMEGMEGIQVADRTGGEVVRDEETCGEKDKTGVAQPMGSDAHEE